MGLEEHLITMFSEDFEFGEAGSHLGARGGHASSAGVDGGTAVLEASAPIATVTVAADPSVPVWTAEGEKELKKIPFFVRKKARANTERFAAERGITPIDVTTLYEAKAHYGK
ncbi:MAG: ferredoxin:protochlorophyllide reductase (ATP-dependent) subunit B, partial [Candidatus Nanopelagicales bacterium]